MYNKMIEYIVECFVKKNLIDENDRDIYEYGLDYWVSVALSIAIIVLISIVLHTVAVTILFLYGFISLRIFCGGYHAKTRIKCLLSFLVLYLAFLFVGYVVYVTHLCIFLILINIYSILAVFAFAPYCVGETYSQNKFNRLKKLGSIIVILNSALSLITLLPYLNLYFKYAVYISLGSLAVTLFLGVCKIKSLKGD